MRDHVEENWPALPALKAMLEDLDRRNYTITTHERSQPQDSIAARLRRKATEAA